MKYLIWLSAEVLLLWICINPIRMVMDRHRHYQVREFNGAVIDTLLIAVVMILAGILTFYF